MQAIEIQTFFNKKMIEVFNKNTLDSYRVRSHNALSLLVELKDLIGGWLDGRIKRGETLKIAINETICALREDMCIVDGPLSKKLLSDIIEEYSKKYCDDNKRDSQSITQGAKLIYHLDGFIATNNKYYLPTILDNIFDMTHATEDIPDEKFTEYLSGLDSLCNSLACELLRIGYSKIFLYNFFKKNVSKTGPFETKFQKLSKKFKERKKRKFLIIIPVPIKKSEKHIFEELKENLPDDVFNSIPKDKQKKFTNKYYKFFVSEIEAIDSTAALKKGREILSSIFDTLQLGSSITERSVPYSGYCYFKDDADNCHFVEERAYSLDVNRPKDDKEYDALSLAMRDIDHNTAIEDGCKKRIWSALRHLRIGDNQIDLEQKFINYWIALEFLFSSPSTSDTTFPRLKSNLVNILSNCYIRRNRENLNFLLKSKHYHEEDRPYWEREDIDDFINNLPDILLKYRLKRMKSHLHHSDKRKSYLDNHRNNLDQHICRLYRLRNELIHEGALTQDIENITSNLRYYLVFTLNQCIEYLLNTEESCFKTNMDTFFWENERIYDMIKSSKYSLDLIMGVRCSNEYVR